MSKVLFISKKCEEYKEFIKFALENGIDIEILREYDNNKIHELINLKVDLIITEDIINNARYLSRILENIPVICISNQENSQNFKELNYICSDQEFKESYSKILKENKIRFFRKNKELNKNGKVENISKKIIIVSDDNEEISELEELINGFYEINSFNSSFKFKIHSKNVNIANKPELIIVNLKILLNNDLDVGNIILSLSLQHSIPIWVITDKIDKETLLALSKFNVSECIIRPFDSNAMKNKLEQMK